MLTEAQLEKRQNNIGTSEGLHYGLSFDAYKAIDAVNASLLKKMPVPAKAKRYLDGFDNIDAEKEKDIRNGLIVHALLFEPERIAEKIAICEENYNRNSNAWKDFVAATPGLLHVWRQDVENAQAAVDAIFAEHGADYFDAGRSEVTGVWYDAERDIWFKMRLDHHVNVQGVAHVILDVKDTTNASEDAWERRITGMEHHIQAQLYLEGAKRLTGKEHDWLWLIIESQPPYLSVIRGIEDRALSVARDEIDIRVALLQDCIEHDRWPGYRKKQKSGLTAWAYKQHFQGATPPF